MTDFLLDLASYQQGINLTVVKQSGFTLTNIKTSQGAGYVWSQAANYANIARDLGFTVGTFHWLDNSASGATQANIAYQRMTDLGGPDGMFHQCDCEDNATEAIMRDYVNAMQDKLGRHIVIYTGDWWWTAPGRNWYAADLTPYLWAAPNNGYLNGYPGDTSPQWAAGYGGWDQYSILQYAVQPISGAGGGNISKSAIRDPNVISTLVGGKMATGDADKAFSESYTGTEPWVKAGSWMTRAVEGPLRAANQKLDALTGILTKVLATDGVSQADINEIKTHIQSIGTISVDQSKLATDIANALIASNTNGLTTADHDAVVVDVKRALREGVA